MIETEDVSVKAQPSDRVITIAILHIATDGMSHIGRVDAYLILTSCLQTILDKRMCSGTVEDMEMRDGVFSAIVYRTAVGDISTVVLQPVGYSTLVVLHLATDDSHITAVIDDVMPVVLEDLLRLHVLGIYHQTTGITVEAVHNMRGAVLPRAPGSSRRAPSSRSVCCGLPPY